MKMIFKSKVLALVASIALLGGTAFVASGSTGAYFTDSHNGTVGGNVGSILVSPDTSTNINFSNLLPGVAQTLQVNYHNYGTSPEDVWLVFPNATALSALNNFGRYASVTVGSNGPGSYNGIAFTSTNLNDRLATCGSFGPSPGCDPLPNSIKIAGNVAPSGGANENFTFTFEYATGIGNALEGANWNTYPLPGLGGTYADYASCHTANPLGDCTNNQTTVNPLDSPPSGTGLQYQLVATQVGVLPTDHGGHF